ncbi:MAG: PKD domain-containing protein [Chloroflexota bacterium]|nr:PKD domain-containing protein [Chloroflexota bacterium]
MNLAKRFLFGMMSLLLVFGLMPSVIVPSLTLADTPPSEVWVDDDFNESTPGWGIDHFDKIQEGIDAVSSPGTVHVTAGYYIEKIAMKSGVEIIGAGAGNDTLIHSIIDGGGNGSVVTAINIDSIAMLDGFTIMNGTGTVDYITSGGGFYLINSSPTISYCIVQNNSASWGGGMYVKNSSPQIINCTLQENSAEQEGGGIYSLDSSSPILNNCIFVNNDARWGGGIYNRNSSADLSDCIFDSNTASEGGGGVYNQSCDSITVINCRFSSNLANDSASGCGGGIYNYGSSVLIGNCTFEDNTGNAGGGIWNDFFTSATINDCTFYMNTAEDGGGVFNCSASPTIINCWFNKNSAIGIYGNGGAIHNDGNAFPEVINCIFEQNHASNDGGAIHNDSRGTSQKVISCVFKENSANRGGAIHIYRTSPLIVNSTFWSNTATDGGAIYNYCGAPTVTNCSFFNNIAGRDGGALYNRTNSPLITNCVFWSNNPDEIYNYLTNAAPIVTYCDVQGGYLGTGNINQYPIFVDAINGGLNLQPGSPCIDAGSNAAVPDWLVADIDSNFRIMNGDSDGMPVVDMGAYEYVSGDPLDQIQANVMYLRGLFPLSDVGVQFITEEELEEMLEEEITEEELQEISITHELLVMLDQMNEGEDLYSILMDLYSGSIAGFYDDEQETIYIVSDGGELEPSEKLTIAHEYTHALQDQHFDLSSLFDFEYDSDAYMAVDSLVEGDARFVESLYFWNCLTDDEREAYLQSLEGQEGEGIEDIPRIILEGILFPYIEGENFVYTLATEGGWAAVNLAYSDPPQSTEQILHPEKYYLELDDPQTITLPDLVAALGEGWSLMESDVLGELDTRIYLETFLGVDSEQASNAAEGWDGDRYAFLKDSDGRRLLVMNSVWDSVADAEEFFDSYIAYVNAKTCGACTLVLDGTNEKWWDTAESSIYLGMYEDEVVIIIAPDVPVAGQVLAAFPEFHSWPQVDFCVSHTEAVTGGPVQFNDCSIGTATSWAWDFDGDGEVDSTDQNPSHTYDDAGVYTVSFTAFDPIAEYAETKENLITVYMAPDAEFGASTNAAVVGQIIQFTDSSTGDITSWAWDFDADGVVDSTERNPSYTFTDPGTYTVSLTASNPAAQDVETKADYVVVSDALCCQVVTPESDHVVQTSDGTISIYFPAGSVSAEKQVIIRKLTSEEVASAPAGFMFGNTCFAVEGAGELGEIVAIMVKYSDEDMAVCSDPSLLTLARYDEESGEWIAFLTTVDTLAQTLTTTTDQLSDWTVMAEASEEPEQTGQTEDAPIDSSGELSEGWPFWVWGILVVAGILVVGTYAIVLRRRGEEEAA